ncbi:uncharacterized protein [Dermacentor albipictus]|uniref:uncharacterized protein isoform X2 n=1 Tax=Dermacentor albipictus TaxID=60249 RepID=UPI0038FC9976
MDDAAGGVSCSIGERWVIAMERKAVTMHRKGPRFQSVSTAFAVIPAPPPVRTAPSTRVVTGMSTSISRLPIVPPATPAPTMPSTSSTTTRTPTSTTTTKTTMTTATTTPTTTTTTKTTMTTATTTPTTTTTTKTTMTTATTTPTTTTTTKTTMTTATTTPTTTTTTRTTTTTIKMTTTTTTTTTTSTTTTTTTRPRTTTSYAVDKGPLLCTIKAPNRYPAYRLHDVENQHVPKATVCDYIIVDSAQLPDGGYEYSSYGFLRNINRYLFTIDNGGVLQDVEKKISSSKFNQVVRYLNNILTFKGCGMFEELSSAGSTRTPAEVTSLRSLYKTLHENLQTAGIKTPFTFYGFRPYKLEPNFDTYTQFMQSISGMASVIIILTITEGGNNQPEPPGAWDSSCLYYDSQTRIEDAVRLISMVTPPMNMFALAISFRIDVFPKVQLSQIRQNTTTPGLEHVGGSSNHIIQDFKDVCDEGVYKSDMQGVNFKYFPDGCCTFAKFTDQFHSGVASFETAQSIQDKERPVLSPTYAFWVLNSVKSALRHQQSTHFLC